MIALLAWYNEDLTGSTCSPWWAPASNATDGFYSWPITNTAANDGMRRVGHWFLPALPAPSDDPPNFAAPRILPRRQSDRAPLISLAQHGYWLNQCGRRLA